MKTEINIYVMFAILIIHWFGDFVMQSDEMGKGKSTSNYFLTTHVLTYAVIWFVCCFVYVCVFYSPTLFSFNGVRFLFLFPTITFISHWITDYFTSRLNTKLHKKNDIHNFFVSIGADQVYHYIQLVITFQLLTQ